MTGIDPLRGRTLGEALLSLQDRVAGVDVSPALDAAPGLAQAAWWVAAEAVANALKHAPGAPSWFRADARSWPSWWRSVTTAPGVPTGAAADSSGSRTGPRWREVGSTYGPTPGARPCGGAPYGLARTNCAVRTRSARAGRFLASKT